MADPNPQTNSEASSSTSAQPIPSSPPSSPKQAGPLPKKRGEIGFSEDLHAAEEGRSNSPINLPARHPADRDNNNDNNDNSADANNANGNTDATPTPSNDSSSTLNSTAKRRRLFKFFKPKKIPAIWGLRITTLIAFLIQLGLVGATLAGWVLTIRKVSQSSGSSQGNQSSTASSSIFVHVVFAIAVLGQLIFMERRLFMLRAQRYTHVHPGQFLPTSRYLGVNNDPLIAFSPWNRPPLPTYAAALAQSGVGTGDVEDHIIAQPPPPAYGNTRGSTLLLQGYLRDSLRAQRPPSGRSQMSQHRPDGDSSPRPVSQQTIPNGRPVSYRSTDSEWEVIQDAERARRLEETLSTLERPSSRR